MKSGSSSSVKSGIRSKAAHGMQRVGAANLRTHNASRRTLSAATWTQMTPTSPDLPRSVEGARADFVFRKCGICWCARTHTWRLKRASLNPQGAGEGRGSVPEPLGGTELRCAGSKWEKMKKFLRGSLYTPKAKRVGECLLAATDHNGFPEECKMHEEYVLH